MFPPFLNESGRIMTIPTVTNLYLCLCVCVSYRLSTAHALSSVVSVCPHLLCIVPPVRRFACAATVCAGCSSPKYGLIADRYHFCEKCFNEIQGNSVTLGDDPAQPQT